MAHCGSCGTVIAAGSSSIKCSGILKSYFHVRCVEIRAKDWKVVKEYVNIKWFWKCCIKLSNLLTGIHDEIDSFRTDIGQEMNNLKNLIKKPNEITKVDAMSHAKVAIEAIVVKPPNVQRSEVTRKTITENTQYIPKLPELKEKSIIPKIYSS
ncbi:hypothetical protein HHI36_006254 [Cryptolaemus montrouzieri]|uniref:PARP-type domain-containing protein n=1 Tax=Cryptolaemus montrouzieri TaxID=559131 RepID=A0ABD2NWT1_9CUCU